MSPEAACDVRVFLGVVRRLLLSVMGSTYGTKLDKVCPHGAVTAANAT